MFKFCTVKSSIIVQYRVSGVLIGSSVFFLVTNFRIWSQGSYGYNFEGFILCYTLAIPFFTYNVISTFMFSGIIEGIYKFKFIRIKT